MPEWTHMMTKHITIPLKLTHKDGTVKIGQYSVAGMYDDRSKMMKEQVSKEAEERLVHALVNMMKVCKVEYYE